MAAEEGDLGSGSAKLNDQTSKVDQNNKCGEAHAC